MHEHLAQMEISCCDSPQTRRGHERRLAFLLSANDLFLERGFDAVSLDDIVNHAGGSKASIYKYFGNKEGLFTAICDYRREIFFKDICYSLENKIGDLRSYLFQTLINFYHHIMQPCNIAFMRLVIEQTQNNPELALYLHEKGAKLIQLTVANELAKAHEQGKINCTDPISSAMMYFGILRNYEWRIIMGLDISSSEQEVTKHIEYCLDRFLDGHQKV